MQEAPMRIIYDGDCPVCARYVVMMRLKRNAGDVQLINAREDQQTRDEMTAQRLDLDQGMVVDLAGRLYHGADAMHLLAMLTGSNDSFNRLHHWLFRSKTRARLIYPWLRAGRNLLLRLRGSRPIDNLNQG